MPDSFHLFRQALSLRDPYAGKVDEATSLVAVKFGQLQRHEELDTHSFQPFNLRLITERCKPELEIDNMLANEGIKSVLCPRQLLGEVRIEWR